MNSLTYAVYNEVCELMIPLTFFGFFLLFLVFEIAFVQNKCRSDFSHPPQNDGSSPTVITIAKYIFNFLFSAFF